MSTFDSLGISGSGLLVHRKWLDAVSDNIANINNVTSTPTATSGTRTSTWATR
jgi:flagellar basal-body rod protein FlgC